MSHEEISFDTEQQASYDAAYGFLQKTDSSAAFEAPIPTLVSLNAGIQASVRSSSSSATATTSRNRRDPFPPPHRGSGHRHPLPPEDELPTTMLTPGRGHHALQRAVDELEGLEKDEQTLLERSPLARCLTEIITRETYSNSREAIERLHEAGQVVPRRVCQHPFKKNDIVWVCRTCQADETCVLCHACFSASNHEGHDVAFYHAQAGGCCDCGDPDAWDPAGFCPIHGPRACPPVEVNSVLPPGMIHRVRGVVPAAVDWMVQVIVHNAHEAYQRVHEKPTKKSPTTAPLASSSGEPMDIDLDSDDEEDDDSDDEDFSEQPSQEGDSSTSGIVAAAAFPLGLSPTDHALGAGMMGLGHPGSPTFPTVPMASSPSSSRRVSQSARFRQQQASKLGKTGAAGHGLYLILYADDIHSSTQIADAIREFLGPNIYQYYTDTTLQRVIKALRQYGQLVIWGNLETATQVGVAQFNLWIDQDETTCTKIGSLLLDRAERFTRNELFCGVVTRDELLLEQRAVALLQWLSEVARSCDPLCQTVAECILPNRHLVPLLRADFKMSARVTKAWYSLLLTLLAVPTFKSHLAAAYCDTYRYVTSKYARGMGVLERSGYTLSVQFLNRVTYVVDLVKGRDLLHKLGKSLLETMLVACRSRHLNGRLDPNHFVLSHRRYAPCISDLKCVLNVKGMPRLFACKGGTFLWDWIDTLSISQQMDPQNWRHWKQGHVEDESRGWVGAFNASISLGSLFERLLGWEDDEESPITDPTSPLSRDLMSCSELSYHILVDGVCAWQKKEMLFFDPTPMTPTAELHMVASASLPFSTVAFDHGTAVAMRQLPISQNSPFSFHLPLHRFVAGCLRELCLRVDDKRNGIASLLDRLKRGLSEKEFDQLFLGLMEFPMLIVTRASQVRAGLWRRNGPGLSDQVLNFSEPPFCRTMRDGDLLLAQFAIFGRVRFQYASNRIVQRDDESEVGMAFFINLLMHRLGVFDFCGMRRAPDENITQYVDETEQGLYPAEPRPSRSSGNDLVLPPSYSPASETAAFLVLLEEFLYIIIMLISELPQVAPLDRADHTEQARRRLYREVVHRLSSGPKTHSELLEVHHVMSHWDNLLLSEEGKLINPDDATGAALGKVLDHVAIRKVSRGKLEPDKWEIKPSAWEMYDPSFFHISPRMHQIAAENRPKPKSDKSSILGWKPQPYAPTPPKPHPFFVRLRRDASSDAAIVAIVYRVLHMHLRADFNRPIGDIPGKDAYGKEKSEVALTRCVHILTLGIYAWEDASKDNVRWRHNGGGSVGSIFHNWDQAQAPTAMDWVSRVLMANPEKLTGHDWYRGEESMLKLLHRLAVSGGVPGEFVSPDVCVRAGAAWICDFVADHSAEARSFLRPVQVAKAETVVDDKKSKMAEKQRRAREKALAALKAQADMFAGMMEAELDDGEGNAAQDAQASNASVSESPQRPMRAPSFGSAHSNTSSVLTSLSDAASGSVPMFVAMGNGTVADKISVPPRLLKDRPRCIICNDEDGPDPSTFQRNGTEDGEGQRKRSRRRTENALGFVAFVQPSTVLKGGGGAPPDSQSRLSPVCEFVGCHVALCGHAIHSECCESYLATMSQREDRVGKRDEFRCPLCQRLSNCLVPFIDVGADWIDQTPSLGSDESEIKMTDVTDVKLSTTLHAFLSATPWWITRNNPHVLWDGQAGFIAKQSGQSSEHALDNFSTKTGRRRGRRPLTKKDLYAAWNAMMRTPRFMRKKLRSRASQRESSTSAGSEVALTPHTPEPEESTGETVVWRRFMDQVADLSYRADSKRLGDEHLHDLFGEFRHYVVEKYAYNMANRFTGGDPVEWPSCVFKDELADQRRQEMSREKILSKLFLTVQSFSYSCSCEAFEAKRVYKKVAQAATEGTNIKAGSGIDAVLSKYGIAGLACNGNVVVMPRPNAEKEGGLQPFDGRLGKLRYLALALVAAAGAVAGDLVQLAMDFPVGEKRKRSGYDEDVDRAPITYPILLGNVLTHVVAAMCATVGRSRARSDSLDMSWSPPFSNRGSFIMSNDSTKRNGLESVVEDCEGFLKLGLMARVLQVLLGKLSPSLSGFRNAKAVTAALQQHIQVARNTTEATGQWAEFCALLVQQAISEQAEDEMVATTGAIATLDYFSEACEIALSAGCNFLIDAGTILQIILPGSTARFEMPHRDASETRGLDAFPLFQKLSSYFKLESPIEMVSSIHMKVVAANWYYRATNHGRLSMALDCASDSRATLRSRLFRTQGFRIFDWPSACDSAVLRYQPMAESNAAPSAMEIESLPLTTNTDASRPPFSTRKVCPLLGGCTRESHGRPRVAAMPAAYTDLYVELRKLMPECEQTAVCLVCGEVLNAGGKGECTRHSYKCGAGTGIFFLLQECSGLILHRSKAAYIHSPYVDSHGETPQHRGRPLNLDLDRYEHLREVWYGHAVRQQVIAERSSSRQVILPDFY